MNAFETSPPDLAVSPPWRTTCHCTTTTSSLPISRVCYSVFMFFIFLESEPACLILTVRFFVEHDGFRVNTKTNSCVDRLLTYWHACSRKLPWWPQRAAGMQAESEADPTQPEFGHYLVFCGLLHTSFIKGHHDFKTSTSVKGWNSNWWSSTHDFRAAQGWCFMACGAPAVTFAQQWSPSGTVFYANVTEANPFLKNVFSGFLFKVSLLHSSVYFANNHIVRAKHLEHQQCC